MAHKITIVFCAKIIYRLAAKASAILLYSYMNAQKQAANIAFFIPMAFKISTIRKLEIFKPIYI